MILPMPSRLPGLLATSLLVAGCASDSTTTSETPVATSTVEDPSAEPATTAGAGAAATPPADPPPPPVTVPPTDNTPAVPQPPMVPPQQPDPVGPPLGGSPAAPPESSGGGAGGQGVEGTAGTSQGGANAEAPTPSPESPGGAGGQQGRGGTGGSAEAGGVENGEPAQAGAPNTSPGVEVELIQLDTYPAENFSYFVTSYHQIDALARQDGRGTDGFGGDLRYAGTETGLEGADLLCQTMAAGVGFGQRTWKAYLSTSTVNGRDRIGTGPWYDFAGKLVAQNLEELFAGADRPPGGCCDNGVYDELGHLHDGVGDANGDGTAGDDDHDTMTASGTDGNYVGFSCDDWTSTTATDSAGGRRGGIQMGHTWPARSGQHWSESHKGHNCAAGYNFIQNGSGDRATVGGGGGYGGFYCFAID